ncbi:MAG: VapC toxin family PIN domain ribonuclease [Actinomyces sp.]|nr:MAG: VapC toxin family PIN domain ribonuclease [Actinomyces sp.]
MNYIDTSFVALSLLGQEGASRAASIVNRLHREDGLISSVLFRVELLRLTHRTGTDPAKAQEIVDRVRLVDINDDVIERACAMTEELKSLDAIHLATALLLDDPGDPVTVFTHDARLAHAARGLAVFDSLAA